MKIKYFGRAEKLMAFLSVLLLFMAAMISKEIFEDSIKTHDSNWMSHSGNSYINLTYIEKEPIATDMDGTNLYLAGYRLSPQLTDYFILQADPESEKTQEILKNADKLEENPQRILGSLNGSKANKDIQDIVRETSQSTEIDSEILLYFDEENYFSMTDLEDQTAHLLKAIAAALIIYIIFAAIPNIFILVRYLKAKKAKREFFENYPELMGQLQNIENSASYLDQTVGLAIYKDHLLAFNQNFAIADLRKTKNLMVTSLSNLRTAGTSNALLALSLIRSTLIRATGDSKKDKRVLIASTQLDRPEANDKFVAGIQAYSPAIEINYR